MNSRKVLYSTEIEIGLYKANVRFCGRACLRMSVRACARECVNEWVIFRARTKPLREPPYLGSIVASTFAENVEFRDVAD